MDDGVGGGGILSISRWELTVILFVLFKDFVIFFLLQTCRARKSQSRIDAVSKQCTAAFWLLLACDFIMAALISLSSKRPMRGDEVTLHH